METMKAVVFKGKDRIAVEEVPKPRPGAGEAVIRITATTICGTDVHIVRGEYPVKPGLVLGHEPVGVIDELGAGLERLYTVGQRVIVGAITPCGQCFYCLNGVALTVRRRARRLALRQHDQRRLGRIPAGARRRANLAPIPDDLTDEDVVLCPDIFSTGLSRRRERQHQRRRRGRRVRAGPDRPVRDARREAEGRVAHHRRRLRRRAARGRPAVRRQRHAEHQDGDPVPEIKRLTDGRGVDVAIEALGPSGDVRERAARHAPGGTLSSLGVYSGKLVAPYEALYAGLGDQRIVTTLCPGGKERMRRLMAMIENRRVDLTSLVTHQFALDDIQEAYDLFSHQRDGVLKVALLPDAARLTSTRTEAGVGAANPRS